MNEKNTAQTQKEEREEVLKEIRQLENRKKILWKPLSGAVNGFNCCASDAEIRLDDVTYIARFATLPREIDGKPVMPKGFTPLAQAMEEWLKQGVMEEN